METEIMSDEKNVLVMKLLHYFITEKNYNPIILQGVENEIWLENLNEDWQVIRLVSNYIHNDEQFEFDIFKTKRITKKIKKKTLSFKMNVMSIFLDLGDNVETKGKELKNTLWIKASNETDLQSNKNLIKNFPDIVKKLEYNEKGVELFMKITKDINKHNKQDAVKVEKVFKTKVPYITYGLLIINIILYVFPLLYNQSQNFAEVFCVHGPSIRAGQYYRLLTGMFMHGGIMHIIFNCYALYVIGTQLESFIGKFKYLVVYLFSGLIGALFSMIFNGNTPSLGASGAIFGLIGSIVYFGYHYRVYLGNVIKSQIIPLIVFNLIMGFMTPGIDNSAHIGGLIGGGLVTIALGIKDKSTMFEKINGTIVTIILLLFSLYMAFVVAA